MTQYSVPQFANTGAAQPATTTAAPQVAAPNPAQYVPPAAQPQAPAPAAAPQMPAQYVPPATTTAAPQYPMSARMAGGQSLGSMITTTDMGGERNPPIPQGNHVIEIVETGRAERKLALWMKCKIVHSDQPELVGGTYGKVFMFGQDGGAKPGQVEMRERQWNAFIYRTLGFKTPEEAAAAGVHPGAVLDACAANPAEIAGKFVAVSVVPNAKGKRNEETGELYLDTNWSVVS